MELFDAIHHRRTHRDKMSSRQIPEDDINKLIGAAMWAPSPFNVQPWEFILITGDRIKSRLAEVTARSIQQQFKDPRFLDANRRWMRLTREDWENAGDGVLLEHHISLPPFVRDPARLRPLLENARHLSFLGQLGAGKLPAREFAQWVKEAPLLILILIDWRRQCPGEGGKDWMLLGMGAMIQNLLLAATAQNIATQFISAPIESSEDRQCVRQIVHAPDGLEPIALLRLGYPEIRETGEPKLDSSERETVDSVRRRDFVHYEMWGERSRNP